MRVLALDYGSARCGCAVSDPTGVLATPIEPVLSPRSRRGLARLRALVAELDVERVVVGLPLSLSGSDTTQTAETREFAAALERALPVPVELYDERFTTRLAERSGGRASEDSRAAAHLLESWLARTRRGPVSDSARRSAEEREAARLERERRRAAAHAASGDRCCGRAPAPTQAVSVRVPTANARREPGSPVARAHERRTTDEESDVEPDHDDDEPSERGAGRHAPRLGSAARARSARRRRPRREAALAPRAAAGARISPHSLRGRIASLLAIAARRRR